MSMRCDLRLSGWPFAGVVAIVLASAAAWGIASRGLRAEEVPAPPVAPAVAPAVTSAATSAGTVDFAAQVWPLLVERCHDCHGPEAAEGGLRLTSREALLAGGDSGQPAIVPGDPGASRLLRLVRGEEDNLRMPPADAGEPLAAAEVDLLAAWVADGAAWPAGLATTSSGPAHWSFVPPRRPELPAVRDAAWVSNPIDRFVLARLEAEGLSPAPEADRYTLARRVALDLIGLPLDPAEVTAFVADRAPDSYERLVDRLLDDPAYGEHWAGQWLDLARYADSKGYGSDPLRTIWRYRDWVIGAYNANLPFDRFTIEQLAGDLLPNAVAETILATAFHRNTMSNDEGGTDDEEFRVAAVKDRVDTTFQVWMGLTIGCAKCHSHKFDPISQREYYAAFALFNQTADADRNDEEPKLVTPTPRDQAELDALAAREAALETQLAQQAAAADQPTREHWNRAARWTLEWWGWPGKTTALRGALRCPPPLRTTPSRTALDQAYREWAPALAPVRHELTAVRRRREALLAAAPRIPVLRELPPDEHRTTRVLLKGNYLNPGPQVEPSVPAAFLTATGSAPRDRLELARWLVSADNPLTGRVTVNRYWTALFGQGLVATPEDFGTQGSAPSHPELLDWLAVELAGEGNLKRLLRLLVTSATYRQSSVVSAEVRARDPDNRLLARGPAGRLTAEMVRDQALAISGLLSRKLGGPSVYPPQPDGLWRAAFNGERTWPTSTGPDRFRRAVYTYWRRTVPYPSLATFDAPSREVCTLRRISTNTPLQAFVTLNDPVYVEAAQALARRLLAEGGGTAEARAGWGLRVALGRPATAAEVAEVVQLYQSERAHFEGRPDEATKLASEPLGPLPPGVPPAEAAAWTVVGNVLLNLDGVLSKR